MNNIICIIPTLNAGSDISRLLDSIIKQNINTDIAVIDSSSTDDTLVRVQKYIPKTNIIKILKEEFDHGGARQLMVEKYPNYQIYVFLTQDAYLKDDASLQLLVSHFNDPDVGAVCGRQLPHLNANLYSKHARYFNYPDITRTKTLEDKKEMGLKVAFISNSFAAYRGKALEKIGGFPKRIIFAEDMFVAAKMLISGWKIVYDGKACCYHSHNYSHISEFRRYFDMGVFHSEEKWIENKLGKVSGQGLSYIKSEIIFLGLNKIILFPIFLFRDMVKIIGFKLGKNHKKIPLYMKIKLTSNMAYWNK